MNDLPSLCEKHPKTKIRHELEDNEVTFIWESWCKVKCVKYGRKKIQYSKYNYI